MNKALVLLILGLHLSLVACDNTVTEFVREGGRSESRVPKTPKKLVADERGGYIEITNGRVRSTSGEMTLSVSLRPSTQALESGNITSSIAMGRRQGLVR